MSRRKKRHSVDEDHKPQSLRLKEEVPSRLRLDGLMAGRFQDIKLNEFLLEITEPVILSSM